MTTDIKHHLIESGLTASTFARALGVHRSTLYRYLSGKTQPPARVLLAAQELAQRGREQRRARLAELGLALKAPDTEFRVGEGESE